MNSSKDLEYTAKSIGHLRPSKLCSWSVDKRPHDMGNGPGLLDFRLAPCFFFLGCTPGPNMRSWTSGSSGSSSEKGGRMPLPKSRSTTLAWPSSRLRTRRSERVSRGRSGFTRGACAHPGRASTSRQLHRPEAPGACSNMSERSRTAWSIPKEPRKASGPLP